MEQLQLTKRIATLIGRIETPLITKKTLFWKNDCLIKLVKYPDGEKRAVYTPLGKLVKGERRVPDIHNGFRGYVKITSIDYSEERLKRKMEYFIQRRFLGKYTSDGFGRVHWLECSIKNYQTTVQQKRKKFKIRKGLGPNYPQPLQRLLVALMLHDFFHTEKHPSKIYREITIEDEEIKEACKNHHKGKAYNNQYLPLIKRYDAIAALITRKKYLRNDTRYDKTKGEIDFQILAEEITARSQSAYKLYNFIYHSSNLKRIVEALNYQKTSLRSHLLLMVNLAINEYYMGTLKIVNNKIIYKKFSESTTKKEKLDCANDAEKRQSPIMNKAESENKTSSVKKRQGT